MREGRPAHPQVVDEKRGFLACFASKPNKAAQGFILILDLNMSPGFFVMYLKATKTTWHLKTYFYKSKDGIVGKLLNVKLFVLPGLHLPDQMLH